MTSVQRITPTGQGRRPSLPPALHSAWTAVLHRVLRTTWFNQLILFVIIIAVWQAVASLFNTDLYTSSPVKAGEVIKTWAENGTLLSNTLYTLQGAFLGFVIGGSAGGVAGFLLGRAKTVGKVTNPFIIAVYAIPKIALAPIFVVWVGIGLSMKVLFSAVLVFFIVFFTMYTGVRRTDPRLFLQARLMQASALQALLKVELPQAGVWLFTGLRMAMPEAIAGAVVGEFIASNEGLGYLVNQASQVFDSNSVFAGLIVLMALCILLQVIVKVIERWVMPWESRN